MEEKNQQSNELRAKNNTLILLSSWIVGGILLIWGFAYLFMKPLGGALLLIASALILPPVKKITDKKFKLPKIVRASLVVVLLIGMFIVSGEQVSNENSQISNRINYTIVERWDIPNGGEGKVIVISHDYVNERDMVTLGEQLKSDTKNDRNAFISVFDDERAAALRKDVLSENSNATDTKFYDEHFVGDYKKNANTGYHEFNIFFDGVMGANKKTINY